MGESVKGAYPQVVYGHLQQGLDAAAHFRGSLVGKGYGQQALRRDAFDIDEPGGTMSKDARLAAAGTGDDQQWSGWRRNGFSLSLIQRFEYRCNVHLRVGC
jgi:hypothetical protein